MPAYRVVISDISRRKRLESQLEKSLKEYRDLSIMFETIFDAIPDVIGIQDIDHKIIRYNKTGYDYLQLSSENVMGKKCYQLIGRGNPCDVCATSDVYKTKKPSRIERYIPEISRWLEICAYPVIGKEGNLMKVIEHLRDITDLKNAQTLLEVNKLQLETILNNINLSIYITDLETNQILFVNSYLKQFFIEDLIGKVCWQSIHENKDGPCEFCTNRNLIDGDGKPKDPCMSEIYNQKRNEWYEKHDSTIPWDDGRLVHLGITRSITAQKKWEEKEKKVKKILEEKVKERTAELEDMNSTLKVLLKKREEDRDEIEDKIFANHKYLLFPIIDNLKKSLSTPNHKDMIEILESELKNILSPFSKKLSDQMINLTPTEIHVADLIKIGKSNKEISQLLNCSCHTIARHRDNIRIKTGLKNKKVNLRSFLLSLQ